METVWKFELPVEDKVTIRMPRGARILSVAVQHDKPCIWALVDPDQFDEDRTLHVRGTGHDASDLGRFVGTFHLLGLGGSFVGHLFEGLK